MNSPHRPLHHSARRSRGLRAKALVPLALLAACASAPSADNARLVAGIEHVVGDIVPIDAAGNDSGRAQSLRERMATLHVPGISIAVFDSGRIIWARALGVADASTGTPLDTGTLFQAASLSKPVTSVAVFRLVEQGHLFLDQDVNAVLRSWSVPANPFTADEKVTPRRIVTHMAGLTVGGFAGYAHDERVPTLLEILRGDAPANSPAVRVDMVPGTRERYSGGGFVVLQLLVEEVSSQTFGELVSELVLRPSGMDRSTFSQPLPAALEPRAATGHDSHGIPIPGRYRVHPELAPAGLWSTPSDMARFMLAVGRSYRGEPGGLLTQASARTMMTPVPGGSGQGFGLSGEGDAFRYRHSGGNVGFTCYAVAFTGVGRGMVVMTNGDGGTRLIRELTRAVARTYGWPRMWVRE